MDSQSQHCRPRYTPHAHSPLRGSTSSPRQRLPANTHSKAKIGTLSSLSNRPDTIPSGKDTGIPARSLVQCREVSTDCKSWLARSCSCRPSLYERARCTHGPKHVHRNKKQTSKADPCVRLIRAHYVTCTLKLHRDTMPAGINTWPNHAN